MTPVLTAWILLFIYGSHQSHASQPRVKIDYGRPV